ncbi:hypothetical protein [Arthrobacter sp. SLBN-53]|uniref:hypothetical protein n=1 Tax=Arthrobacter sp. SLBN-53 TaxID=2768412 RepID=UPI00114F4E44|nr:hypothetical protein [Arthrobacter sp. SLBN-53]TQK29645.1 hypothetical protein FBY28_2653 [Arthrobacter sp. SLBN-53]
MKARLAIAALLTATGICGPVLVAPLAAADEPDIPSCTNAGNIVSGSSTVCQSPGDAQLTSSPGELGQTQFGMWPWSGGIGIL